MERCPTCKAKYRDKSVCYRCGTDLGLLLKIEKDAAMHLEKVQQAFLEKKFEKMFFHARRSWSLRQLPEGRKMLACAAILTWRFKTAIRLYRGS